MALPEIEDVSEIAEDNLLWQWRNSPKVKGLLKSFTDNLQPIEDALFQLLDERGLDTAVGEQLDVLGRLIGEDRVSRDDETYRVALVGRITSNNSDGSTEEVLASMRAITGANYVTIFEHFPASFHILADSGISNGIVDAIDAGASAGVGVRVLFDLNRTMFRAAEFTEVADLELVNDLGDNVEVIDSDLNLYNLIMGSFGVAATEDRSIFPEYEGISDQLLLNPDFLDGLTSWTTLTGSPTVTSGVLTCNSGDSITQSFTTVASVPLTIMLDAASTSSTFEVRIGTTSGGSEIDAFATEFDDLTNVGKMIEFTPTGTTTYITLIDTADVSTVGGAFVGTLYTVTEKSNVLCDVMDSTEFGLEFGNIVTDLGDFVVSDLAENIKYLIP